MKIFIIWTFGDRDYVMNVVLSPYVLGDEIRIFRDEKCHHRSPRLLQCEMKLTDTQYEEEDIDLEDELDELTKLPQPKETKSKSKSKTNCKDHKRRTSSI